MSQELQAETKEKDVEVAGIGKKEEGNAKGNFFKLFMTCAVSVAMSCAISIPIGYHMAMQIPVPPQVAVLNIDEAISDLKNKDVSDPVVSKEVAARSDKLKKIATSLSKDGIVVLDAKYVLKAPQEAFVDVNSIKE